MLTVTSLANSTERPMSNTRVANFKLYMFYYMESVPTGRWLVGQTRARACAHTQTHTRIHTQQCGRLEEEGEKKDS